MANEEQLPGHEPGEEVPSEPAAGSESQDSGPAGQPEGEAHRASSSGPLGSPAEHSEELTVEDILSAEQDLDAANADPLVDEANPYLEDLRRITAEYANYRKRTEANAVIEKQRAAAAAVGPLLSVLDDLDRAEQHGDLEEGSAFGTIAQKIRGTLERMGVEGFGEKGEPFDPQVHEAIAQVPVPGTEQPTVLDVIERGYRIGDVELRAAKVAVAVGADG
jgi:molecular chaperone GrpE